MSPTAPSADGPGVPYRCRAVICQYGMYQAIAHLFSRPGSGRLPRRIPGAGAGAE